MLVTDDRLVAGRDLVEVCRQAVAGGVTMVQLRLKEAAPRQLLQLARQLRATLPVPVVVNDRADVARLAGVGVHLGPDDLPVSLTRPGLPPGALLGGSVGSAGEAEQQRAADYWGVGPWRETSTKPDAGLALGAAGLSRIVALARGIPCVAIGGVRPQDVAAILATGCVGVAVVSGILGHEDVEAAARRYALALAAARRGG
jgi:thiamine-phosphate pyrophosphorylase